MTVTRHTRGCRTGKGSIQRMGEFIRPNGVRSMLLEYGMQAGQDLVANKIDKAPKLFSILAFMKRYTAVQIVLSRGVGDDLFADLKPHGRIQSLMGRINFPEFGPEPKDFRCKLLEKPLGHTVWTSRQCPKISSAIYSPNRRESTEMVLVK